MHRPHGITRQQVLLQLKVNGPLTADEVGRSLSISPVAARQHLSALTGEGLVEVSVERRGLGRPVHRFGLTGMGDETFPRSYADLACAILDGLRTAGGVGAVQEALTAFHERARAAVAPRLAGKPLDARVRELAAALSEMGHMATAHEVEGGYHLVYHNCVICRVARSNAEACAAEMGALQDLVGPTATVRRIAAESPGAVCAFAITPVTAGVTAI